MRVNQKIHTTYLGTYWGSLHLFVGDILSQSQAYPRSEIKVFSAFFKKENRKQFENELDIVKRWRKVLCFYFKDRKKIKNYMEKGTHAIQTNTLFFSVFRGSYLQRGIARY